MVIMYSISTQKKRQKQHFLFKFFSLNKTCATPFQQIDTDSKERKRKIRCTSDIKSLTLILHVTSHKLKYEGIYLMESLVRYPICAWAVAVKVLKPPVVVRYRKILESPVDTLPMKSEFLE